MINNVKNFYEILEVDKSASLFDIKNAYKKLVRIYHPDINKDKNSEIVFKMLNNAYEVLSDNKKRKEYDLFLNSLKATTKKIPSKNSIIKEVRITEEESIEGTTRIVNILKVQVCPNCLGNKFYNGEKCGFCLGEGKKKEKRRIEVKIPKNVKNYEYIYVGKINSSEIYDRELFLKVIIEEPQKMTFENEDIILHLQIPLYDAILGVEKEINIKNIGIKNIVIPPLTKPNSRIYLDLDKKVKYFAQIEVIFPKTISNEEKILYDKIRKINRNMEDESKD